MTPARKYETSDAEDACFLGNDPGGLEPYVTDPDGHVRHASFVEECRPRDLRYTLPVGIPTASEVIDTSPESYKALAEELRKAIFDVELMIEVNQVTDGPRNSKERVERAERHALVGRLTKIRRALYRSKDVIENLEA